MRVKKISGSYRAVCTAVGGFLPNVCLAPQAPKDLEEQLLKDLDRIPLFGTIQQKIVLRDSWSKATHYTQGDESAVSVLATFIGGLGELVFTEEGLPAFDIKFRGGYLDDRQQAAGLSLFANKTDPAVWLMAVVSKATASLDERVLTLYFSEAAYEAFVSLRQVPLAEVDFYEDFEGVVCSEEVCSLVGNCFSWSGEVDLDQAKRLDDSMVVCGKFEKKYSELSNKISSLEPETDSVSLKKREVFSHLIGLFDKADSAQKLGYVEDAKRAKALAHKLAETCERFFDPSNSEVDWTQMKRECKTIVNEAKKTLVHYDFWQVLMSNFLLAVTGLCIVKAVITGSFFLHNSGKACYEEIESTYKILKDQKGVR